MISTEEVHALMSGQSIGDVLGEDGTKIGRIGQVYLDDQTSRPEWITTRTGMFGNGETFVPLARARVSGTDVVVPFDKDRVKDAPRVAESDGHLSQEQEAELVGTRSEEAGRVRLRKYVVTENVTKTVPIRKEKAVLEREPITEENLDQALDGPSISEEEHEVTLHEEQPVVDKKAVPVERCGWARNRLPTSSR